MTKRVVLAALVLAVMFLGAHQAFAQTVSNDICFFGIFCIGGGGSHPAPAPLLAAGIPAFAAAGGGVAVSRLCRKLRRR